MGARDSRKDDFTESQRIRLLEQDQDAADTRGERRDAAIAALTKVGLSILVAIVVAMSVYLLTGQGSP